jgi:VWFA-related protein
VVSGFRTLLLVVVVVALCGAQQTPAPPAIRVNVDLAQVEVVVTDSGGHRISDLGRDDFQLLVDGKEKILTHLSFVDTGKESLTGHPGALRREDVHRTLVFMIDEVHTSPANLLALRPVVRRFTDEQISPGDLISIMSTRNNMGIYERFTSDPNRIRAAMDRLVRLAGQNYDKINQQDRYDHDYAGLIDTANAYMMEAHHGVSMGALERAIEGLRNMPGRKAIVWFSDGIEFPLSQLSAGIGLHVDPSHIERMEARTRQIADLANRNGVVIYTFDAKTLFLPDLDPTRRASLQNVPYLLAKETGGIFSHDTNALSDALGKAMEDMTGYYLLAYKPERSDNPNRRIQVKVRRAGLTVRTRTTVSAAPEDTSKESHSREELLRQALFSPFAAGDIRVRLSPVYSAAPPDPKTGARRPMLRALLSIDGRDLRVQTVPGGKKQVVLDVAAVAFDVNNKPILSKDQRFHIVLPDRQPSALGESSVTYQLDIGVPKPGPYEIRAAVRDDGSGAAGSAGTFVELPDFNKQRLVLSSLVLSDAGEDGAAAIAAPKVASRSFAPGGRINYGFQVYGARAEKPRGVPKLDFELRLHRDGAQVFVSKAIPLAPDAGEREVTVVGSFVVPPEFAEGEYIVQVIAHDRSADSKRGSASQWTDFTLSK